jgi:uncharacterized protein Yka (UPF0111/DUF47 family)
MAKAEIVERLGEAAVLLPDRLAEALAANDRAKLRLTILQEAAEHARVPANRPHGMAAELRRVGLAAFEGFSSSARALDDQRFSSPGLVTLMSGLAEDLQLMLEPLKLAQEHDFEGLGQRLEAVSASLATPGDDSIEFARVGSMTAARRDGPDSAHKLIMDLHRAINQLAAATAVEDIDGAKVHHLAQTDRECVGAFMRGLNRTAPLAFGHPGLGTTAARTGDTLVIQNDIGETDAHVLVVHVDGLTLSVTYTDVHRRRARFFMDQFDKRTNWSPLAEHATEGLGDDELFYLVTGELHAQDEAELLQALDFLGSRIVFLIDWNKARKTLQTFVEKDAAVDLLEWAARQELGHRAFLVLGGGDLVMEAVRRTAEGRIPYGVRLDDALGGAETRDFLRRVLEEASQGLRAGRSVRLIRDEVQAHLAARFETAESAVLAIVVRHLGLSRTLAGLLAEGAVPGADSARLAERAKRMEAKADRLTVQARESCARLQSPQSVRALIDAAEDAMDALEDCAFLFTLAPPFNDPQPLQGLARIVAEAAAQMTRAAQAAARLPDGWQGDTEAALRALDAVARSEREADAAERSAVSALMSSPAADARPLVAGLEIARKLERASDHFAHAAFALRQRVLEELSA